MSIVAVSLTGGWRLLDLGFCWLAFQPENG
jgi:hypothetical protein